MVMFIIYVVRKIQAKKEAHMRKIDIEMQLKQRMKRAIKQ